MIKLHGEIKRRCEDFVVEEIPAYEPSGEGTHLYLWIEKRDASARFALRELSRVLGVSSRDIGFAGNKDRRAVTQQYYSVPVDMLSEEALQLLESSPVQIGDFLTVKSATRHKNKLRRGHLYGNRFVLVVGVSGASDADELLAEVTRRVDQLSRTGMKNLYGDQRFGREESTVKLGNALLAGEGWAKGKVRKDRFLKRLALNAVQSKLFNVVLEERLAWDEQELCVRQGDVLTLVQGGSLFVCEDPEVDQQRFEQGEVMPTGPMFGPKMKSPEGEVLAFESNVLKERFNLSGDEFGAYAKLCRGTRRPYFVGVEELSFSIRSEQEIELRFLLPSGSYATVLLEQLFDDVTVHGSLSDDDT